MRSPQIQVPEPKRRSPAATTAGSGIIGHADASRSESTQMPDRKANTRKAAPPADYIFFDGRRIAWKDSAGNVYYYFADAIGSTRAGI